MLYLLLADTISVMKKYPQAEEMPKGYVCTGRDIKLMPTIAVLNYLHGVKAQWSCQGNHKKFRPRPAYLLLPVGEFFPRDLSVLMESNGFFISVIDNYDEQGSLTSGTRHNLKVDFNDSMDDETKEKLNEKYIRLINQWAIEQINQHIPLIPANRQDLDLEFLTEETLFS